MGEAGSIRGIQLARRYRAGELDLTVFSGLDITIAPGERVAITGESGAGKSTLLHVLAGLDAPTAGRVFLGETEITGLPGERLAALRNQQIGFVWQFSTLLPEFTAEENVGMPLLIRGEDRSRALRLARRRLAEVGLEARARHLGGELSGGEQQRVVLARALAAQPRFLLADEPTGNLDSESAARVMDLLEQVHGDHNLTTVYVTHNLDYAKRASRVIKLELGKLIPLVQEHHV